MRETIGFGGLEILNTATFGVYESRQWTQIENKALTQRHDWNDAQASGNYSIAQHVTESGTGSSIC